MKKSSLVPISLAMALQAFADDCPPIVLPPVLEQVASTPITELISGIGKDNPAVAQLKTSERKVRTSWRVHTPSGTQVSLRNGIQSIGNGVNVSLQATVERAVQEGVREESALRINLYDSLISEAEDKYKASFKDGELLLVLKNEKGVPWFLHLKFTPENVRIGKDLESFSAHINKLSMTFGTFADTEDNRGLSVKEAVKRLAELGLTKFDQAIDVEKAKKMGLETIGKFVADEPLELNVPDLKNLKIEFPQGLALRGQMGKVGGALVGASIGVKSLSLDLNQGKSRWNGLSAAISKQNDFLIRTQGQASQGEFDLDRGLLGIMDGVPMEHFWFDGEGKERALNVIELRPEGRFSKHFVENLIDVVDWLDNGMTDERRQKLRAEAGALVASWTKRDEKKYPESCLALTAQELKPEQVLVVNLREKLMAIETVYLAEAQQDDKTKRRIGLVRNCRWILSELEQRLRLETLTFPSLLAVMQDSGSSGSFRIKGGGGDKVTVWADPKRAAIYAKTVAVPEPLARGADAEKRLTENDRALLSADGQPIRWVVKPETDKQPDQSGGKLKPIHGSGLIQHRAGSLLFGSAFTANYIRDYRKPLADLLWATYFFEPKAREKAEQEADHIYRQLIRSDSMAQSDRDKIWQRLEHAFTLYQRKFDHLRKEANLPKFDADFLKDLDGHLSSVRSYYQAELDKAVGPLAPVIDSVAELKMEFDRLSQNIDRVFDFNRTYIIVGKLELGRVLRSGNNDAADKIKRHIKHREDDLAALLDQIDLSEKSPTVIQHIRGSCATARDQSHSQICKERIGGLWDSLEQRERSAKATRSVEAIHEQILIKRIQERLLPLFKSIKPDLSHEGLDRDQARLEQQLLGPAR